MSKEEITQLLSINANQPIRNPDTGEYYLVPTTVNVGLPFRFNPDIVLEEEEYEAQRVQSIARETSESYVALLENGNRIVYPASSFVAEYSTSGGQGR